MKFDQQAFVVILLEQLETAGISASISQTRMLADSLVELYPAIANPVVPRQDWNRWTESEYDLLQVMYERGDSWQSMQMTLDKTRGQVNGAMQRLRERGVVMKRPPRSDAITTTNAHPDESSESPTS